MNEMLLGVLLFALSSAAQAGQCREFRPFMTAAAEAPLVVQAMVTACAP